MGIFNFFIKCAKKSQKNIVFALLKCKCAKVSVQFALLMVLVELTKEVSFLKNKCAKVATILIYKCAIKKHLYISGVLHS